MLVLVLERPTRGGSWHCRVRRRPLATRVQAVAFVPAIVVAPLLPRVARRNPLRRRSSGSGLYLLFGGSAALLLSTAPARPVASRTSRRLCGRRREVVRPRDRRPLFLYHLAELDLYLGVLPFRPRRPAHPGCPRRSSRRWRRSSRRGFPDCVRTPRRRRVRVGVREPDPGAEHFVVAPFFLIAARLGRPGVLGGRASSRRGRDRVRAVPLRSRGSASSRRRDSDTLALLPIGSAYGSLLFDSIDSTVLAAVLSPPSCCCSFAARWALVLPAVTLLSCSRSPPTSGSASAASSRRRRERSSRGSVSASGTGSTVRCRTAPGPRCLEGVTDRLRSTRTSSSTVGRAGLLIGGPTPAGSRRPRWRSTSDGCHRPDGRTGRRGYVLTEDAVSPDGSRRARPRRRVDAVACGRRLVATATVVDGLYPTTLVRSCGHVDAERCRGGTLTARSPAIRSSTTMISS